MYNLYPITSLKDWYSKYSFLIKEKDIWKNQEWVLFHHKMISEYLKKEILEKEGITFAPFIMESIEPSFFFWITRLISEENIKPIVEERPLFILLYLANKELNLLDPESKATLNLLQKTAILFFYYERENSPLLKEWKDNPLNIKELSLEEKVSSWQRILWQFLFIDSQRNYLSLNEALKELKDKTITKEDFPFSSLIVFTDYNLNEDVVTFLSLMEEKGWDIHHISFLPSFYALSFPERIRPPFYENWLKPYLSQLKKIKKIPNIKENYSLEENVDSTLLNWLKKTLKEGLLKEDRPMIKLEDNSFRLIEAISPLIEIEILSDKILEAINSHIKLEEMVLLTHEKDLYYPIVEKVFKEKNIPFFFQGDIKEEKNSFFIKAINDLLSIGEDHFSQEEVFNLLSNPLILKNLNVEEEDFLLFKRIMKEAKVLYGYDKNYREKKGFPATENNTWQKAFQRIYLGLVTLHNEKIREKPPLNISLLEWRTIHPFIKFINQIYKDISYFSQKNFSFKEWGENLSHFFTNHLGEEYPEEETLRKSFSYMEKITKNLIWQETPLPEQAISFNFFKIFFNEILLSFIPSTSKEKKGIQIGSYQTLGVIPHTITFICGMHHKNLFPKNPSNLDLHLKEKSKREESPSLQTEREDFLRILFQSEKKIILSYIKENPLEEEKILYVQNRPPFINEILSFLKESSSSPFFWHWENNNPLSQVVEKHPYWEFDKSYFKAESTFSSLNKKAFHIAKINEEYRENISSLENINRELSTPEIQLKEYNWYELRSLLRNPYEKYFKETLNIHLNEIKSPFEKEDYLEDYDPSLYSWLSIFWEKMEEVSENQERILSDSNWEKWQEIFENILEIESYRDSIENNIYTNFNKREWQAFLEETNNKIKNYLPLKRENINFQEGLEKEDVGKWTKNSFSLIGAFPYDIFRKEDLLLLVTYKTIYCEDLFLILVLLSLYKYHIYPKCSDFIFKEFHLLQATLSKSLAEVKPSFFWDEINELPLEIIEDYISLSLKKPLPFYLKTMEYIISLKDSQSLGKKDLKEKLKIIFSKERDDYNQFYRIPCPYLEEFPWEEESLTEEDFKLFQKIYKVYQELMPPSQKEEKNG